jgi:hypothetical protein
MVPLSSSPSGMDASAWVAVVAAAIAVVAVVVAFLQARSAKSQADAAKVQADAAVRQTELQERVHRDSTLPYVWADFRLDETQGSLIYLVVRNEGPTVAEEVQIYFEPALQGVGLKKDLDALQRRLTNGLRSLPPGREMRWWFAIGHVLFDEANTAPLKYQVRITGRGPYGDLPEVTYVLDLDDLRELAAPKTGSLADVAKAIAALRGGAQRKT